MIKALNAKRRTQCLKASQFRLLRLLVGDYLL